MDPCDVLGFTPVGWVGGCKPSDTIGAAAGSAFDKIVSAFGQAAQNLTQATASSWLRIPAAHIGTSDSPTIFILDNTQWIASWLAVLGLLFAAGRMAWERKSEPAKAAASGILRLFIVGSMSVAAFNLLSSGGNAFSVWIVDTAMQCTPGGKGTADCGSAFGGLLTTALAANPAMTSGLLFFLYLLVVAATLLQIGILLMQQAVLPILVGTLPLSAAASSTSWGRAWWRKSLGLTIAFLAYKPAAAIVYAAAFSSMNTSAEKGTKTLMSLLTGCILLALAVFTLPALMRLAVPLTESLATGGAGRSLATAGTTVATGAMMVKTGGFGAAAKGAAGGKGAAGAKSAGGAAAVPTQQSPPGSKSGGASAPPASGSDAGKPSTPGAPGTGGPQTPQGRPPAPSSGPAGGGMTTGPTPRKRDSTEEGPSGNTV